MTINETKGDLFELNKQQYVFAHCIAVDLKWGAGIAPKMFSEFGAGARWRNPGRKTYRVGSIGIDESEAGTLVNLFTKENTWDKPAYDALRSSLTCLYQYMWLKGRKYLAIPRIGCGLDGLEWTKVKQIIEEVFAESGITIEIRYL